LLNLEVALMRSGKESQAERLVEDKTVQQFGHLLFEFLFSGEILSAYRTSLSRVRDSHEGLRVKLRLTDPKLAYLPWEYLYDDLPSRQDFLCLSTETVLVRYVEVQRAIPPLNVATPLRILGMVVNPKNFPHQLNVAQEKQRVEAAVQELQAKGLVELHWLEGETWRELQNAFRNGPWHIFHFIGHGAFDKVQDEGQLIFADSEGNGDAFGAKDLARLLDGHKPLRLALLNACEGAKGGTGLFSATAPILVGRGLPAVVAMQQAISDTSAIEFARTFYESVADGYSVDAAVTEARKAMSYGKTVEWAVPVLYMRAQDGVLFEVQGDRVPSGVDDVTALLQAADDYYAKGRFEETLNILQQALNVSQTISDYLSVFNILKSMGQVCIDLGWSEQAIELYSQAYRIGQEMGHVAEALDILALIARLYESLNQPQGVLETLNEGYNVAYAFGDTAEMEEILQQVLLTSQQCGDYLSELNGLVSLGQLYIDLEDLEAALEAFMTAYHVASENAEHTYRAQAQYRIAHTQYLMAYAYANQQDLRTAVDIMKDATKLLKKIDHPEAGDFQAILDNWKWLLKQGR
ncbi:MAG: CHAT domain-containing protein, partial [Anaerolineales bacterium]|nr:CHAT domain-containing protein [Anaerolineales bacterium]